MRAELLRIQMQLSDSVRKVRSAAAVWLCFGILMTGISTYKAVSSEITGAALYRVFGHRSGQVVSREHSPSEFRAAVNVDLVFIGIGLAISAVSYFFFFQLNEKSKNEPRPTI